MKKIVLAIDGNSSTGKSSLAKALALHLDYKHIDSGAMYRSITLEAMKRKALSENKMDEDSIFRLLSDIEIDFRPTKERDGFEIYLNNECLENEIRSLAVSRQVSKVAKLAPVRHFMVKRQRELGEGGGVVMDGRDIGTTVFPNAEVKIFLRADPEVRAKRRFDELMEKGEKVTLDEVTANIKERDFLDKTRSISPLTKADKAIEIDSTNLSVKDAFDKVLEIVNNKIFSQ